MADETAPSTTPAPSTLPPTTAPPSTTPAPPPSTTPAPETTAPPTTTPAPSTTAAPTTTAAPPPPTTTRAPETTRPPRRDRPVVESASLPDGLPSFPAFGGSPLTIAGHDLAGATGVTIGGVPALHLTVLSDTSIRVTTPAHEAGKADIVVTTPAGDSAPFPVVYHD